MDQFRKRGQLIVICTHLNSFVYKRSSLVAMTTSYRSSCLSAKREEIIDGNKNRWIGSASWSSSYSMQTTPSCRKMVPKERHRDLLRSLETRLYQFTIYRPASLVIKLSSNNLAARFLINSHLPTLRCCCSDWAKKGLPLLIFSLFFSWPARKAAAYTAEQNSCLVSKNDDDGERARKDQGNFTHNSQTFTHKCTRK